MEILDIVTYLSDHGLELSAEGSCLYPSAGGDGRALSFTHPEFLRERGASEVAEIGVYVFLDRATPRDEDELRGRLGDERTQVRVLRHDPVRAHGIDGELLCVEWRGREGHERISPRRLAVLMLRTDNEAAAPVFAAAG